MMSWLVNDRLTCIPGTRTFWHMLLDELHGLQDMTGGHTPFHRLAESIEKAFADAKSKPRFLIRNASYFRPMNLPIPQISLLQDATPALKAAQAKVIASSALTVVNSAYVASLYEEVLPKEKTAIIPLGTDMNLFRPQTNISKASSPTIMFIGAPTVTPKGWDRMEAIMGDARLGEFQFYLVMKAPYSPSDALKDRVVVFHNISQEKIVHLASQCHVGLCTSRQETQHLSGIEMMACGLPVVASPVGIYWDFKTQERKGWGCVVDPPTPEGFVDAILDVYSNSETFYPRRCVWEAGLDSQSCFRSWRNLVLQIDEGLATTQEPKIYDCFNFYNEVEVLHTRLDYLYDLVDVFEIVESLDSHSKKVRKPSFVFEDNLERFKPYLSKIRYFKIPNLPYDGDSGVISFEWPNENFQKNACKRGIQDAKPNDWILFSDVDEIPSLEGLKWMKQAKPNEGLSVHFCQKLFYYTIDLIQNQLWWGSVGTRFKNFTSMMDLRTARNCWRKPGAIRFKNGGWHYSYQGGTDRILMKMQSYAESDHNSPFVTKENIEKSLEEGIDVLGRTAPMFKKQQIDWTKPGMAPSNMAKMVDLYPFIVRGAV